MLNKKAIAAFAAGATLLAGFAVSAPAFAGNIQSTDYPSAEKLEGYDPLYSAHASDTEAKNDFLYNESILKAAKTNGMSYGPLEELNRVVSNALASARAKLDAAKTAKDRAQRAFNAISLPVKPTLDVSFGTAIDEDGTPKAGYAVGKGETNKGKIVKVDAKLGTESVDANTQAADKYIESLNDFNTKSDQKAQAKQALDNAKANVEAAKKALDTTEANIKNNWLVTYTGADGRVHADLNNTSATALEKAEADALTNGRIESLSTDDVYENGETPDRTMNHGHRHQQGKKSSEKQDGVTPDKKAEDASKKIEELGKLNLSDAAKKKLAIHYVYKAKLALDEADNDLAEAKDNYAAKRKALLAAKAEFEARRAAAEAANQALTDFLTSGVNDSAKQTKLQDVLNRAHAHEQRAFDALTKAQAEFDAARDAAFAAVDVYNKALAAYKDAYNDAVRLGVNPAKLPPLVTVDPIAADFPVVPGTKQIYADALAGKFGADIQKSAQKAEKKDSKVAAKGGSAAAGSKALAKTGVSVALTALAASVLAGVGAAVRKFRH